MEFTLNYSPEAAALYREGLLPVDRFKLPDWDDLIAEARAVAPVYVHFPFTVSDGSTTVENLQRAVTMAAQTNTPYINTHLFVKVQDLNEDISPQTVKRAALDAVRLMVEHVGRERVIVENVPYPDYPFDLIAASADPELISTVIESADVGLLLDIGHARRTAEHLAIDPRIYINRLPVQRLREVHITGLGYNPDGKRVDHLPMREDDWELFAWVLDNIHAGRFGTPWAVSCEYGGVGEKFRWRSAREVIARESPRMAAMVKAAQPIVS